MHDCIGTSEQTPARCQWLCARQLRLQRAKPSRRLSIQKGDCQHPPEQWVRESPRKKREQAGKLRCMGRSGVKGLIIFYSPRALLKATKNSVCLRMKIFFPPVKLNGHPTCCLVKWDHSRKMELARSHLLTARGRSEQQSLDQDLNFSPIQMCLDPEAGWHPSLLHLLCDYVWMALVLLTTPHVITCIWASFCKEICCRDGKHVMLCRIEIHP